MPGDLHGLNSVTTSPPPEESALRKAGVRLAELAIVDAGGDESLVNRSELLDMVSMIGLKVA